MTTADLTRELSALYRANARPSLVDVPERTFLSIDGSGSPDAATFQEAIGALYALAYGTKFRLKKTGQDDFRVAPLEGFYATEGGEFRLDERERLSWTLAIPIPATVPASDVEAVRVEAIEKKGLAALELVRIGRFTEGHAAQILHVGPYTTEPATIELLHGFIGEQGFEPRGRHHEIYLGDPRRAAPEKLKTILRQPVA